MKSGAKTDKQCLDDHGTDARSAELWVWKTRQIAALPERSVRAMKSVLNKSTYADVETALELETQAAAAGSADPETQARVRNFKT